jgi:NAD(P)-dependent dehydrogenase (short-subunit alcohol dehydrogenase family)
MQIKDSVALITGANRGIGRALVTALLARGARRVYAAARNPTQLQELEAIDGARVNGVKLDVTNIADVDAVAARANDVSLLINNAAILDHGRSTEVPLAAIRANMETNFFGTLNVSRAFIPVLERNHGAVVNMLTIVALASMPPLAAYNASKAAVLSLTQSMRGDLAPRGITVYGVFPGPVDTDMSRGFAVPKTPALDVALATLDGVEAGSEDIFPDSMAQQVYSAWRQDHKAIERQFAAM